MTEQIREIEIVVKVKTNKRTFREIFTPFENEDNVNFIRRVKNAYIDIVWSTI